MHEATSLSIHHCKQLGLSLSNKLVETRTKTEGQAKDYLASYEAQKEGKCLEREEKKNRKKMTTNISTQLLLNNVPSIDHFPVRKIKIQLPGSKILKQLSMPLEQSQSIVDVYSPYIWRMKQKKWYRSTIFDDAYAVFQTQLLKAFTSLHNKLQLSS